MDLHFGDSRPTDEERAAVDALLGPPESSWEGADRSDADLRWARGGRAARDRRDLLLPGLHALNDRVGWISEGGLGYLCRRLTVPPAEAYGVATFYALFSVRPRPATVLHMCTDLACAAAGADALCTGLEERVGSGVSVEGSRTLVPACSRRAEPGMEVRTGTERARHSRKVVLELLASSVDLSTTPGAAGWIKEYDAKPDRFGPDAARLNEEPRVDNELYVRDYGKCILCYKCVDACGDQWQNTFAISVAGRGFGARIAVEHDAPLTDSACVYCGNCVEVCPAGALAPKTEFDMRAAGTWDESRQTRTSTVCAYCGVGCTLTLHVQDNEIVKVTSPHDNPVTHGNLCIKGRFGYQHVQNRG